MTPLTKRLISFLTCICFLAFSIVSPAYANERIATVQEGDPAPFTGTLFSTEAAARLLVDLETNKAAFEIECTQRLDLQRAEMQLQIDVLQASKDALQMRYDDTLLIKNQHIDFLERQVTRKKFPPEALFIIGVVSGIGLTLGAAYGVNQVSQN